MARFLVRIARALPGVELEVRLTDINGQPGAIAFDADGRIINILTLDIASGRVEAVRAILNPDKLRHLGPVADLWRLLREARGGNGHT